MVEFGYYLYLVVLWVEYFFVVWVGMCDLYYYVFGCVCVVYEKGDVVEYGWICGG